MAAVERNLDDMTGSITRQIDAAKAAPAAVAWPDPNTSTPEAIAAAMAPPNPPAPPNLSRTIKRRCAGRSADHHPGSSAGLNASRHPGPRADLHASDRPGGG